MVTVGADYRHSAASDLVDTFAAWAQRQFGDDADNPLIAGPDADPDHDQLANLLEYALSLNPANPDPSPVVAERETIGGSEYLRVSVAKNPAATDVAVSVEGSGSLDAGTWGTAGTTVEIDTPALLQVRDSAPIGSAATRFLRVKAVLASP